MGEDSFFDALAHIMWDMEIDIFSEKEKTLALIADFVPQARKQYKRLRAMYDCGAMELIEQAVSDKDRYAELMWQAVDCVAEGLSLDEERAVFSVNRIIALWDGDLPELDPDDEEEGDDMLFLADVAEAAETAEEQQQPAEPENTNSEGEQNSGGEEPAAEEKPPVLSRIVRFWCDNECSEGRPLMAACPIGWIEILLCAAVGIFMVADVCVGDKLCVPVFFFMFTVLVTKRHYHYRSTGRLSICVGLLYLAAAVRALWTGSPVALRCLPVVLCALIVFNNGRISVLLDGGKRRTFTAYLLITIMAALVQAGVYAIQNVSF